MEGKKRKASKKQRRPAAKPKRVERPQPRTPSPELEIIGRKTLSGPSFYHTVSKPGCNTIYECPEIPPTPALFQNLRPGSGGAFTVGDIPNYPGKKTEEKLEISEHDIQDASSSDGRDIVGAVQVIPTSLAPRAPEDLYTRDIPIDDIAASPLQESTEPLVPITPKTINIDRKPHLTLSKTIYTQENLSPESMRWVFGDRFGGVAIQGHAFVTNKKFQTLHNHCQKLYDEFLEAEDCTSKTEKEMEELQSRLQNLKTKAALARKKSEKLIKKKEILSAKRRDTYIAYILQHVDRLIDLRKFIERMNGAKLESKNLPTVPDTKNKSPQPSTSPGFEFVVRKTRRSTTAFKERPDGVNR